MELLAIVFAAKRFHQYVFGRPVIVQTDHKPLEAVVRKPLNKAPAPLQGMLLQMQKYDLSITYTPGKHMHIADALSQATLCRYEATDALSEGTLSQLKAATAADSVVQAV